MTFRTDCAENRLEERVLQLNSLAHLIVGGGFEAFSTYSEEHQHNVLFLIARMTDDAVEAMREVNKEKAAERGNAATA